MSEAGCSGTTRARFRCPALRLARMARVRRTLGPRDLHEAVRVWSHRGRRAGRRFVHHSQANGRSARATIYRARALR